MSENLVKQKGSYLDDKKNQEGLDESLFKFSRKQSVVEIKTLDNEILQIGLSNLMTNLKDNKTDKRILCWLINREEEGAKNTYNSIKRLYKEY